MTLYTALMFYQHRKLWADVPFRWQQNQQSHRRAGLRPLVSKQTWGWSLTAITVPLKLQSRFLSESIKKGSKYLEMCSELYYCLQYSQGKVA